MKKGLLITLEGNEGCGKSTQIRLLESYLKSKGYSVYVTREPGGTKIGDEIRNILLDNRHTGMTPEVETLLYMAARAQLVSEVIAPRLKKGYIVLCDRWLDATVAYQGFGAGVDVKWIKELGKKATQGLAPKISLFLDLPLLCGLRRAKSHKKADRMEKKALQFHKKVRAGYLSIAKNEGNRFRRISIQEKDSIEIVHEKIKKALSRVIA